MPDSGGAALFATVRRVRSSRFGRPLLLAACLILSAVTAVTVAVPDGAVAQTASRYVAIAPLRVVDTREGLGAGRFDAGSTQPLRVVTDEVATRAGVAPGAVTAAVLNVTITQPDAPGHVTVWAAGGSKPLASSLNAEYAGQTIANLVTTPVANGRIDVFAHAGMHLVVDVQGVYVAADSASAGRLEPLPPRRALDTRLVNKPWRAGEVRTVDLRPYGVPETAAAAVVNLTTTQTTGAGHFTVFASGSKPPLASNLNADGPGQTIANQAMAPVANGRMQVYASVTAHLIVDLVGYVTGGGAPNSSEGLFVPVRPHRLLDTRNGAMPPGGNRITVQPLGAPGVPTSGVAAVALNVTLTQTAAPVHATAWPTSLQQPPTSTVNAVRPGQTIANHATTPIGRDGFTLLNVAPTHLVADITGYWTGQPAGPPTSGPHAFAYPIGARWNPCKPIRYATNFAGATEEQKAAFQYALERAKKATGLTFEHVGETTQGAGGRPPEGADAVFAVFTEQQEPSLMGGVVGLGGGAYASYGGVYVVVSGFAYLDREVTDVKRMRKVWLHEIGHMIGLGHVDDPNQVMAQGGQDPVQEYGPGDLEGLWHLGAEQGCIYTGFAADRLTESMTTPPTQVVFVD